MDMANGIWQQASGSEFKTNAAAALLSCTSNVPLQPPWRPSHDTPSAHVRKNVQEHVDATTPHPRSA
jgi:hypothetical protein